ncbi:hypothetical protein B296_00019224 [Ensete ventricosum]|uniref:Uncharacterized protein n=1 Tax=Ensete ventricosum TaxID=4639 RepID=A0A426X1Q5_ENSVE|nr:hypothetical protein B296_00019224 [Ensete ventricosum]
MMRWDLVGSLLGDSPKESGSSLRTRREITRKKTGGLATSLPEVAGVCGKEEEKIPRVLLFTGSLACSVARRQFLLPMLGDPRDSSLAGDSFSSREETFRCAWGEGLRRPVCIIHTARYRVLYRTEINSIGWYRLIR